jgi:hypothetical protein
LPEIPQIQKNVDVHVVYELALIFGHFASTNPVNTFNDLIQINLCDKTTEKANERELLQPDACGIRNYTGISELRQKTVIALESLNLSLMQKKRLHQCNTPEKLMENIISLI